MAGEADEITGATDAQIETAEGIIEALCRPGEPVSAFHVSRYVLAAVVPPGAMVLDADDVEALREVVCAAQKYCHAIPAAFGMDVVEASIDRLRALLGQRGDE